MRLTAVIFIIAVALFFDYTNGFHDAANAIATAVSTKALTPRVALAMAAVMKNLPPIPPEPCTNNLAQSVRF